MRFRNYKEAVGTEKRNRIINGSLTVEAGLVFPVFLFALLALCGLFAYEDAGYVIEKGMYSTAESISAYGDIVCSVSSYTEDTGGEEDSFAQELIRQILVGAADSTIVKSLFLANVRDSRGVLKCIEGGAEGISFTGSRLCDDDECLVINCSYVLKPPFSLFGLTGIEMEQNFRYRYFTGHKVASLLVEAEDDADESGEEEEDKEDIIVYITEEGKVYHRSRSCSCLKVTKRAVEYTEVSKERNAAGAKYYACEKCAHGTAPLIVYIAEDGDRYHFDNDCSALKRTVKEVKLSEVEGKRRPCKRCKEESK